MLGAALQRGSGRRSRVGTVGTSSGLLEVRAGCLGASRRSTGRKNMSWLFQRGDLLSERVGALQEGNYKMAHLEGELALRASRRSTR